eukprot:7190702-Ditylum_brightwellii.AAC.1
MTTTTKSTPTSPTFGTSVIRDQFKALKRVCNIYEEQQGEAPSERTPTTDGESIRGCVPKGLRSRLREDVD